MDIQDQLEMQEEDPLPIPAGRVVLDNAFIRYVSALSGTFLAVLCMSALFKYDSSFNMAYLDYPRAIGFTVIAYNIAVITASLQYYVNTQFEGAHSLRRILAVVFLLSAFVAPIPLVYVVFGKRN